MMLNFLKMECIYDSPYIVVDHLVCRFEVLTKRGAAAVPVVRDRVPAAPGYLSLSSCVKKNRVYDGMAVVYRLVEAQIAKLCSLTDRCEQETLFSLLKLGEL